MKLHKNILSLIGNTPLVRINHLCSEGDAEIWAKLEGHNPGGSVKDRIALSMIALKLPSMLVKNTTRTYSKEKRRGLG